MSEEKTLYELNIGVLNTFSGVKPVQREGNSKSGVFTRFLFGQLGRDGALDLLNRLKNEYGEGGYQHLIDRIVKEIPKPGAPPAPPGQMDLPGVSARFHRFAFEKVSEPDHPAVAMAREWKESHRMQFMLFDQLKDRVAEQEVPYSAKMDGELVAVWFENGLVEVATHKGTLRTGMPATTEAAEALGKKFKKAVLMGELYSVNEHGIPQSYMRSASVIKDPKLGEDESIRLAIFDLISLDDRSFEDQDILVKMDAVRSIFPGTHYVHAAYTTRGTIKDMEELWNQLTKRGLEGLVVHMPDGLVKSKPILSFDMVILAVTKSPSIPGRAGAILASFMDKEGRYRLNGHIGTGLTDDQRVSFMLWAEKNKVREDESYIWVDPTKSPVIEVEAVEANPKQQPTMKFENGMYVTVENMLSGTLRFPVLKQIRDDKNPKYPDVGIEQLPFKTSAQRDRLEVGRWVKTVTGQIGKIKMLVPKSGDSGMDYDLVVEFDPPVWGINIAECHPTEVIFIGDRREDL